MGQSIRSTLVRLVVIGVLTGGCSLSTIETREPPRAVDCDVFPPQNESTYVLPWRIGQSYEARPHLARETSVQRFAIDFPMPIGTPIVASRGGIVVRIEDRYADGDNRPGHENYVFVEHDDGTVAQYIHLTKDGVHVDLQEPVVQGQLIGWSGHTGESTAPHLHFDVTLCCCSQPPRYNELPCGRTLPLTFANTRAHACGLQNGVFYPAEGY